MINKTQKKALSYLLTSQLFERMAFYSIMGILVLYMMEPMNMSSPDAGMNYSVFYAVLMFSSLFSGIIGDFTNRMKIVSIGILLTSVFYFLLAILPKSSVTILAMLIPLGLSLGLIKTNSIVFLGNIFNEKKGEIKGLYGFVLLSIMIDIGAITGVLFAVWVKNNFGFDAVFSFTFIISILTVVFFLLFKKSYNQIDFYTEETNTEDLMGHNNINRFILIAIIISSALFYFANAQKAITIITYAKEIIPDSYDLSSESTTFNNNLSVFLELILFLILVNIKTIHWRAIFNFIIIGSLISFIAYAFLTLISSITIIEFNNTSYFGLLIILGISQTLISPIIFYTIYRSSPLKYKGTFQGINFAISALINSLLFIGYLVDPNYMFGFIACIFIVLIVVNYRIKTIVIKKEQEINASNKKTIIE